MKGQAASSDGGDLGAWLLALTMFNADVEDDFLRMTYVTTWGIGVQHGLLVAKTNYFAKLRPLCF